MLVVVVCVFVQYDAEVAFACDQHAVGAFRSHGTYPPFRIGIRSWCLNRSLDHSDTFGGEHLIEDAGVLRLEPRSHARCVRGERDWTTSFRFRGFGAGQGGG